MTFTHLLILHTILHLITSTELEMRGEWLQYTTQRGMCIPGYPPAVS